jgi:hypothetical protein
VLSTIKSQPHLIFWDGWDNYFQSLFTIRQWDNREPFKGKHPIVLEQFDAMKQMKPEDVINDKGPPPSGWLAFLVDGYLYQEIDLMSTHLCSPEFRRRGDLACLDKYSRL